MINKRERSFRLNSPAKAKKTLALSSIAFFLTLLACLCPIPKTAWGGGGALATSDGVEPSIGVSASGLISLNPIAGGVADSDSATITTSTTNYTGYNLYLSSKDSDNDMTLLGGTSSDVIESLTSSAETSSSAFENRWGYKIDSAVSYNPIPTSDAQIATSAVAAPSGAAITLSLAAKVGQTKPQGAYVGNLVLTAIASSKRTYSLTYEENGSGVSSSTMPSDISQTTINNSSITLSDQTPSRTGYIFVSWCTTAVSDDASCTGTSYAAGATITLDPTTANPIVLYAVWEQPKYTISYSLNGGTAGSSAPTSAAASDWVQISNPTKSGATFQGWTISGMDDSVEHYYGTSSSSTAYTTDTTLYTTDTYFKNLNSVGGTVAFTAIWQDSYSYSWTRTTTTYTTSQASILTTLYPSVKTSTSSTNSGYYASSLKIDTSGYAVLNSYSTRSSISYNNYSYLSSFSGKYTCCTNTQSPTNTSSKCSSTAASSSASCYYVPSFTTSTSNQGTSGSYYYTQMQGYKITATAGTPSTTTLTSTSPTAYSFYANSASNLTITKTVLNTGVIDYDANGGTGAPARQTFTGITNTYKYVTLSATIPTRDNYTFLGWATSKAATSATYAASASAYITSAHTTYYAVWTPNYRLYYDINADDTVSGMPQNPSPVAPSVSSLKPTTATFTISSATPTRSGYTFLGWATSPTASDSYIDPGDSYIASSAETTLYAMWGTNYSITYNANGGSGAPASQSGNAAMVTISSTEPTLSDKYFHGWATSSSATEVEFKAGKAYAVSNFAPSKTLYAVWKDEPATLYMQNVDSWGSTLAIGESIQAVDSRDDKTYWVTRLKTSSDGSTSEIWMTQNLDYDLSGLTLQTLSSSTSNVSSDKTLTVDNGWDYEDISFYEGGDLYLPSGYGTATSTDGLASDSNDWHYHVGNYYNWTAATAGSGTSSVTDADATESICPKGWRLPTSNSTTANYSFGKLLTAYSYSSDSDTLLLGSPLWFVRAGYVSYGNLGLQGSYGYVWSSRADSVSRSAYGLYFYSYFVDPSRGGSRGGGFSVRCVAE